MSLQTLTLSQVQGFFKNIGKLIYIHQLTVGTNAAPQNGYSNKIRTAMMAAIDQAIAGSYAEFQTFNDVLVPLNTSLKSTVSAIDGTPTQVKSALTTYLTKTVGPLLDPAKSYATPQAMSADLISVMQGCTGGPAVVTASGNNGTNADGIAMFLKTNLGMDVNNSASGINIDDATYISATVI